MYKPNGHDGYRGLDYDLARGVAKILGLQVNVQTTQFAGLMPALQAHKADIAWVGWLPTPERLKSANFITYLAVPWGVLVRKGNPKGIHALADLCGKTVALLQGTQPPIKLINDTQQKCTTLNKPHIHKLLVPKRQSVVLAVKSRKADAFFSAGTITAFFAKTIDNGQTFTSIANPKGVPPHSVYPQGLAIAKDNSQLLTVTDKALTRLMKSPVYDSILTKYGLQDFGLQTPTVKT
jgi:ABC-type amino acid transport substrate-binding protein